ncbi:hypothetical protein CBW65_14180 [Tumebacillus avium]|uniref:Uncharacterized protein n=1 Tax=Tumebacillus avium TaxID=1903704 RepID=A0A1Y0IQB2_9BACL|nr:hypothetical protein [Tumebacillus avium]ARU62026.1 hypothetical protein CBW65_14180 [Tumebacillus avium]
MEFFQFGWVVIVLGGVLWNILKRIKHEADRSESAKPKPKPWQDRLEELLNAVTDPQQTAVAVPAESPPSEHVSAPAPAPRMSSGARGPAAPSKRAGQPPAPSADTAGLTSRQNLRNALILREVLSEPRAKQPWRPGGRK